VTRPGPRNLITDVGGLRVGNAEDHRIKTGATVLIGETPFVAAVDVMGGSPGTRETDLLAPENAVDVVDALVLAGGSAFGLDAAAGVVDELARMGRGFVYGDKRIPIVPSAILFDLANGGDKAWEVNPYRALGAAALGAAAEDFALGTVGAGTGATTANLKGGLGSASLVLDNGVTVGALVAANPTGHVTAGDSAHFWAAPFEIGDEFGGLGPRAGTVPFAETVRTKVDAMREMANITTANTTLCIVATDAVLSKAQAKRMAVAAQDGIARAVSPAHTAVDGDIVFAAATGRQALADPLMDPVRIGHAAAVCVARAIARAVYEARPAEGDPFPTWRARWGG
jgi:D-aminopeptidase